MSKTEYIGFRVPKELVLDIEELGKLKKKDKSSVIREVFETGIGMEREKLALEAYKKGEVSLERAAEIARLPLLDFIEVLEKRGLHRNLDVQNIRKLLMEELGEEV